MVFQSRGVFSGAGRRRGLFDPPESYGTPGIGDGRNEDIQEPPAGLLSPDQPKPPGFWEGGDKFGWRDGLAGVLAAVGDAFAQRSGGQGGAVQMLSGGRLSAIEKARKAQAQAQEIAAARQRAEAAGLTGPMADLLANGDAKYPELKGPDLPAEVRTSQWYQGADPAARRAYDQTNPIITHGYGSTVVPRSALPGQGRGLPQGYDPNEWEPVEGPQPEQQSQAPVLTQEQWRGAVSALGPQQAEEWRQRHGYQIGGR